MRTRTTTTITGLIITGALALSACGGSKDDDDKAGAPAASKPAAVKVDCSDQSLSQADWIKNCDKAGGGKSVAFGQEFAWPDGVKVTVTSAKVFKDYDKSSGEKGDPGSVDYQVMVRITNGSQDPLDLSSISLITAGATSGGEASATSWTKGAPGIEGTVAPGVSVTKADGESLESKFGRKIVVTVQRTSGSGDLMDGPEFTGTITG